MGTKSLRSPSSVLPELEALEEGRRRAGSGGQGAADVKGAPAAGDPAAGVLYMEVEVVSMPTGTAAGAR